LTFVQDENTNRLMENVKGTGIATGLKLPREMAGGTTYRTIEKHMRHITVRLTGSGVDPSFGLRTTEIDCEGPCRFYASSQVSSGTSRVGSVAIASSAQTPDSLFSFEGTECAGRCQNKEHMGFYCTCLAAE
jgi:hypothetical protein